jgi:hypothetical protein
MAMFMLVCAGLICVAGIQYFREVKYPSLPAVQKEVQPAVAKEPSWHLRLRSVPEQNIFIGFKYADRVYMEISELCQQPEFRTHADNEGLIEVKNQVGTSLLFETPDITLPSQLTDSTWWVVSSDAQPEDRIFDMSYQWLSYAHAPVNGACLFLGQKTGDRTPQEFQSAESEPIIGLMGFGAPLDTFGRCTQEMLVKDIKVTKVEYAQDPTVPVNQPSAMSYEVYVTVEAEVLALRLFNPDKIPADTRGNRRCCRFPRGNQPIYAEAK